ncbi:pyridoxal phosphate-dependent aminotransferase [Desulfosarcina sp. OttesenSCG-928-B08]|nr:pyridoxal phosphate-dependent aminotransferase [Desulfosarcina sp. OttesenSCG-928-B08]
MRPFGKSPISRRWSTRFAWNAPAHPLTVATNQQIGQGRAIIDLTHANPTQCGFRYDGHAIAAALANHPGARVYDPSPAGNPEARAAISGYYKELGKTIPPERILLTASTSEAYGLIFKLLGDPGDEILIPRPGYPLLSHLAGFEGLVCHSYPLRHDPATGWRMDIELLSALITNRTRAVVAVSPNNPTGNYIHPEDLAAVDALCTTQGMALIVDEVFADFSARPEIAPLCTTATQTTALTFVLNGISKMLALPQMKLGWVVVDGDPGLADAAVARLETLMDFYLTVGTPVQLALPRLLETRADIQQQIRARIAENENILSAQLSGVGNMRRIAREGGWYGVLFVEDDVSDEDRAVNLMEADQVLIHPGRFHAFDLDGFVVLSLLPQTDLFADGISRMIRRFGLPVA